jgi:small-conductance mechanosensitive channel
MNSVSVHEQSDHSIMNIERTDKTLRGVIMSVLLTSLAAMAIGSLAAGLLGVAGTAPIIATIGITALAGGLIDIEVTY